MWLSLACMNTLFIYLISFLTMSRIKEIVVFQPGTCFIKAILINHAKGIPL